ncbi:MAG: heavy-metal-associated domain-containing protein, partial [Pseudomonadota bacterium]
MQTVTLNISGMTCGGCVRGVTSVLNALDGVVKADVSLDKQCAVVDYDAAKMSLEKI